jgi:hypothetical protein
MWSWAPKRGPTPRHTGRLTVGRKFNSSPLHGHYWATLQDRVRDAEHGKESAILDISYDAIAPTGWSAAVKRGMEAQ